MVATMNLRFQWEPEEWREAVMLASEGPRRPPKPVMTYAIIGIMSLSAVGEIANAVRSASFSDYSNSLMPMVLFVVAIIMAVQVYTRAANRSRAGRFIAPMPTEEQHVVMNENGWHTAAVHEAPGARIRPWEELTEQRTGTRSLIVLGQGDAFAAVPLRVLSANQGGHLQRLLMRKVQRRG